MKWVSKGTPGMRRGRGKFKFKGLRKVPGIDFEMSVVLMRVGLEERN